MIGSENPTMNSWATQSCLDGHIRILVVGAKDVSIKSLQACKHKSRKFWELFHFDSFQFIVPIYLMNL